ncbi:MAG: hypothetical protein OEL89_00630 [Candidatus Peregrinibacteria bacterium]|nr:hypothetical protein [Candidatus Peregrinibacteria bacterium]
MERKANKLYNLCLVKLQKMIGSGVTYNTQIDEICKKLFGSKFKGCLARDEYKRCRDEGYYVVNLDNSNEPGEHWVGIVIQSKKRPLIYDSFGRSMTKYFGKNNELTQKDVEQDDKGELWSKVY